MNNRRIVIIGFMGAGKTTVAAALARKLNCSAIDLDDLIAQREKRSPKEIIEQDGEAAFRSIETTMLQKVLRDGSAFVLAIGGGAWTIAENRELITERGGFTVWLDAPFQLCWERIAASGESRPLARSREMAQKLYEARNDLYALANAKFSVDENENSEEIAARLVALVLQNSEE
jgi:shikimate kinase